MEKFKCPSCWEAAVERKEQLEKARAELADREERLRLAVKEGEP